MADPDQCVDLFFTDPGSNKTYSISDAGTPYGELLRYLRDLVSADKARVKDDPDAALPELYVCVYSIGTWGGTDLIQALVAISKHRSIVLVTDADQMERTLSTKNKTPAQGTKIKTLKRAFKTLYECPRSHVCKWKGTDSPYSSMHAKIAVCCDPPVFWMGSANATLGADKSNFETAILIKGDLAERLASESIANISKLIEREETVHLSRPQNDDDGDSSLSDDAEGLTRLMGYLII